MHQSARPETMDAMRAAPDAGTQETAAAAASASSRNPATDTNHCSVARKMVGFLVRQS